MDDRILQRKFVGGIGEKSVGNAYLAGVAAYDFALSPAFFCSGIDGKPHISAVYADGSQL